MAPRSLLDFITTLVHDPAAAAAYRADPQSALSAADLPDVTTADIDQLIPVVAESTVGSVWSAGDAAHSFDVAFDAGAPPPEPARLFDDGPSPSGPPSAFDPFAVPDAAADETPEWGSSQSSLPDALDDVSPPAEADLAVVAQPPAEPDWSGTVTVDELGDSESGDGGLGGRDLGVNELGGSDEHGAPFTGDPGFDDF